MKAYRLILATALVLLVSLPVLAGDVVVIANKNVAENALDKGAAERIFLGKKTTWENGDKIVPVTLDGGDAHADFLKSCVGKTPSQFSAYWKQQIFTGKGTPPRSFKNEADLVKYVSETPGAVGYVSSGASVENVKVIKIE